MVAVGRASTAPPVGLPSGGLAGSTLTKVSGDDYAAGWVYASPVGPPVHVATRWYDNRVRLGGTTSQTESVLAGSTVYVPVYISRNIEVSVLAASLKVASSGSFQMSLGVSTTAATGYPGTLLGTASTTASTATGLKYAYASQAFAVSQGWNWLSVGSDLAVSLDGQIPLYLDWPYSQAGGFSPPSATADACKLVDTGSAVPRNTPPVTVGTTQAPLVFFYISAAAP